MTEVTQPTPTNGYAANHQHPANRVLHAVGIPVIAGCAIAAVLGPTVLGASRRAALGGAAAGSALLLLGQVIEGNGDGSPRRARSRWVSSAAPTR